MLFKHIKDLIYQEEFKRHKLHLCLTYGCNMGCSFCLSSKLNKNYHNKDMEIGDFLLYIGWLKKQNFKVLTLLGGEPTLYRKFNQVLDICRNRDLKIFLYTNLMFNKDVLKSLTPDVIHTIVGHYQLPGSYTKKEYKIFHRNLAYLSKMGHRIVLRHNFLTHESPYDYVIDAALKYNVKIIRTSIIKPEFHNIKERPDLEEMKKIGPKMYAFAKKCKENGIKPHIRMALPLCVFSDEERDYLMKHADLKGTCFYNRKEGLMSRFRKEFRKTFCLINPDLTFYFCSGYNLKAEKRIVDYKNVVEVHNALWKTFKKRQWTPTMEECNQCKFFTKRICQGGCLSYKGVK